MHIANEKQNVFVPFQCLNYVCPLIFFFIHLLLISVEIWFLDAQGYERMDANTNDRKEKQRRTFRVLKPGACFFIECFWNGLGVRLISLKPILKDIDANGRKNNNAMGAYLFNYVSYFPLVFIFFYFWFQLEFGVGVQAMEDSMKIQATEKVCVPFFTIPRVSYFPLVQFWFQL